MYDVCWYEVLSKAFSRCFHLHVNHGSGYVVDRRSLLQNQSNFAKNFRHLALSEFEVDAYQSFNHNKHIFIRYIRPGIYNIFLIYITYIQKICNGKLERDTQQNYHSSWQCLSHMNAR